MPDEEETHRYLGDGVYASFDGYHLWLRTGSHDSEDNKVALEPSVFAALLRYHRDVHAPENAPVTVADKFLGLDVHIADNGQPVLHGHRCKPGWYWVLCKHDLEIARLDTFPGGWGWLIIREDHPIEPEDVAVHSGPIEHPYEGRWSACAHDPRFRRGKRCVYCGTIDIAPGSPK